MFLQNGSLFVVIVGLVVSVAWLFVNRKIFDDYFSPFNVLLFVWVLPFIASYLALSDQQVGLSIYAELLVIACTVIAAAICLLFRFAIPGNVPAVVLKGIGIDRRAGVVVMLTVLTAGAAKYFAEFSNQAIPLFQYLEGSAISHVAHRFGKDSFLQIFAIGLVSIGIIGYSLALERRAIVEKVVWLGVAALPILAGILKASKSDVFEPLFYYIVLSYYYNRRLPGTARHRYLVPVIMAAVVALAAAMTMTRTSGIQGAGAVSYADAIGFAALDWPFELRETASILYGYTSLGFENFSRYVEANDNGEPFRLGTSMFRPLLSSIKQGEVANEMLADVTFNEISPAANVGTYLRDLYVEGGWVLCILGTVAYAFLVNSLYVNFRTSQTPMSAILYAAILFPWAWLFFTNAFSVLTTYLILAYVFILHRLISRPKPSHAMGSMNV